MKKIALLALAGAGCAIVASGGSLAEEPFVCSNDVLTAVHAAKGGVTLRPGETEVVVAADAAKTVRFAADEMTNFLGRVLGAPVPLQTHVNPAKTSIVLGDNAWNRAAGLDVSKLPCDAFCVSVASNVVRIAGYDDPTADPWGHILRDSGTRNFRRATSLGVYDFLERHAGVRFYFIGELGTVVPRRASVVVPEGMSVVEPAFVERNFSYYAMGDFYDENVSAREWNILKRLNVFRLRLATQHYNTCHGLRYFRYVRRFAKTHPEYFQMMADGTRYLVDTERRPYAKNGRLCFSNPGLRDEIYADVKAYLTGQPASSRGLDRWGRNCQNGSFVDIGIEDGYVPCFCPGCQTAYDKGSPKYATALVWDYFRDMGSRLKHDGIPGTLRVSGDYSAWTIPEGPIPDNIIVDISVTGPWAVSDDARMAGEVALLRKWYEKSGRKNLLWTYAGKFKCLQLDIPDIPPVAPRGYAKFYRMARPYTIGPYNETQTERYLMDAINQYVFAKLMWNPELDVERLLAEGHRDLFGAGAPFLAKFFDTLERLWTTRIVGESVNTSVGPVNRTPTEYAIWREIYSEAFVRESEALFDRAAAAVPHGSDEAKRIALFRRELLERLAMRGAAYRAGLAIQPELDRRTKTRPANLISNARFEGLKGWRRHGFEDGISIDSLMTFAGEPTLRISLEPTMTNRPVTCVTFPIAVECGKTYRLSFFMRGENVRGRSRKSGANAEFWLDEARDNGVSIPRPYMTGTFDWIHQSGLVKIPADFKEPSASVTLRMIFATGTVWFAAPLAEEVR